MPASVVIADNGVKPIKQMSVNLCSVFSCYGN